VTHTKNKKLFWSIVIIIVLIDQLSKYLVRGSLVETIKFSTFFSLAFVKNTGAGFGILKGQQIMLATVSVLILAGIIYYLKEIFKEKKLSVLLGLIFAGGLGNLIDRLFLGYVTDFLSLSFWPAFNIADSAITLGAIGIIIYLIKEDKKEKKKTRKIIS